MGFTMQQLELIADYLRLVVLRKHCLQPGRSHCSIQAGRDGIRLMIAMGIAEPGPLGDAWDIDGPPPRQPAVYSDLDVTAILIDLTSTRHRLAFVDPEGSGQTNIAASDGVGPALADKATLVVLKSLGLVEDNRWTTKALPAITQAAPLDWLIVNMSQTSHLV